MSIHAGTYDVLMRLVRGVSPLVGVGRSKLARGVQGRAGAAESLREWAGIHRDPERPLLWSHAPSVGEGLQARAILEALGHMHPGSQRAFTFFSPSAVSLAEQMPVHVGAYLPWDVRTEVESVLEALRPAVLSFTKTEVWPGLTAMAVERGVPVVLTAGTLPAGAGRLRPIARWLLRDAFGSLERVMAIAAEDAERFTRLGVAPGRITVTGDPGIDSAWKRASGVDPEADHLRPFARDERPTLVAGSTWPTDEEVLVPVLARLRERFPALRVIIAPHEPTPVHLRRLEARLGESDFRVAHLSAVEERGDASDVDAVVVDRVGVLAQLYTAGSLAYVGGGFHGDGLHSVLEPAAAARPCVFGPRHQGSRAAVELAELHGASAIVDAAGLRRTLEGWLEDPSLARETGLRASGYIEQHRGAAMRTAKMLAEYLPVHHE